MAVICRKKGFVLFNFHSFILFGELLVFSEKSIDWSLFILLCNLGNWALIYSSGTGGLILNLLWGLNESYLAVSATYKAHTVCSFFFFLAILVGSLSHIHITNTYPIIDMRLFWGVPLNKNTVIKSSSRTSLKSSRHWFLHIWFFMCKSFPWKYQMEGYIVIMNVCCPCENIK